MITGKTTMVQVACNKDCGAGCPLVATVRQGKIINISTNPNAPRRMTGCARGFNMQRVVYASDRLTKPLVRTGPRGSGRFKEVSWKEALDMTAENLQQTKEKHGNGAVMSFGGSGACRGALHNTRFLTERFLKLFGGFTHLHGNYSAGALNFVQPYLFGYDPPGIDPLTLKKSAMIILWGANISVTRFSTDLESILLERKKTGTPIVVIDPRKTRTVKKLSTWWIPITPGTDGILMCALLWVFISEKMCDREFIRVYSHGFDELEAYVMGKSDGTEKSPEWAAEQCGVPKEKIYSLARMYGKTHPVALLPGLSIQRTIGGEEAVRLAVALQVATGNVGRRGGSPGICIWNRLPAPYCPTIELESVPNAGPTVSLYRWADAVTSGREGGFPSDIKCIYVAGANYLNQGSDIRKNIEAFEKVDFSVCHEMFLTPTARYCDIVLPVTTALERSDIIFSGLNYLYYSQKAIDPIDDTLNDWDIFCKVAARLGFLDEFTENRTKEEWEAYILEQSEVSDTEEFTRTGIYRGSDQERIGLSDYFTDPYTNPLHTPSGKIEIGSEEYAKTGFPAVPIPRTFYPTEEYPLRMITPHALLRINSTNWNIRWFKDREKQELWIHPDDAQAAGIKNGKRVRVRSEQGEVIVDALVTKDIMPGVVSLLEGAWFTPSPWVASSNEEAEGSDIAVDRAGSANMLTSAEPTLPSDSSRTHSVRVNVSAYE